MLVVCVGEPRVGAVGTGGAGSAAATTGAAAGGGACSASVAAVGTGGDAAAGCVCGSLAGAPVDPPISATGSDDGAVAVCGGLGGGAGIDPVIGGSAVANAGSSAVGFENAELAAGIAAIALPPSGALPRASVEPNGAPQAILPPAGVVSLATSCKGAVAAGTRASGS